MNVLAVNRLLLGAILATAMCCAGADKRVISAPGLKTAGSCSPGVVAGEFLYVSGQGARDAGGKLPATTAGQVRQSLANVKAVVEAAGLTMDHVVYAQVYLTPGAGYDAMEREWREVFARSPAARAVLTVSRIVDDTPVAISAVAVRDLARKKVLFSTAGAGPGGEPPSVRAGDHLYVSGYVGRDSRTGRIPADPAAQAQLALDRMRHALEAAGMSFGNLIFVNPYLTRGMPAEVMNRSYAAHFDFGHAPARATIQVTGLPHGASIEFTGVAMGDLLRRSIARPKNRPVRDVVSPCVFGGEALYCSAKSGAISGPQGGIYASTVENQLRQSMRNLLDGLEEAGLDFTHVVATNIYLDSMDDFARVNRVYAKYFPQNPPACTVVQQVISGNRESVDGERWPAIEQVSLIAVK